MATPAAGPDTTSVALSDASVSVNTTVVAATAASPCVTTTAAGTTAMVGWSATAVTTKVNGIDADASS